MRLEHFERSRRDAALSFASSVGICYDMNYLPFWKRWYYLWRFRKMGRSFRLMPRFFSLDRMMEHYGCKKAQDKYMLSDTFELHVTPLVDDGWRSLILKVVDRRTYTKERERTFRIGDEWKSADILYCPEKALFLTADQVATLIDQLCALREENDDWKYYEKSF